MKELLLVDLYEGDTEECFLGRKEVILDGSLREKARNER